jgi:hypothetical protein
VEEAAAVTPPDWWYPGYFIGLTIFLVLLLLFVGWMLRWGTREVDRLNEDLLRIDESQRAFEADLRRRMGVEDE